jgi:transketolase
MSTGCLGQGFSVAVGLAWAGKSSAATYRVYALLGDGELQSGQVWEAVMAAAQYNLDNLTAIVDRNRLQMDGDTEEVLRVGPIAARWSAFGWRTAEVDGHDVVALAGALAALSRVKGQPTVLVANTVKGKGVSFMEGNRRWHSAPVKPEQGQQALDELRAEASR